MSTFLKTHERLVLVLAVLLTILYLGKRWVDHSADVAVAKATTAQQVAEAQAKANVQTAAVVHQAEADLSVVLAQVNASNQQLLSAIAARTQIVSVQSTKDKTLPLPDLAKRWEGLAGLDPSDITASTSGITVTDAGSRATVQKLESVPVLTQNLTDTQQIVTNKDTEIASINSVNTALKTQVTGLNLQIADDDKVCKAKVTEVKATERKSKWKWFGTGVGIGIGTAVALIARYH